MACFNFRYPDHRHHGIHIQAKGEAILVVGGLGSLGLIAKTDIAVPDKRSFIFLEQSARNSEQMEETLKLTDTIENRTIRHLIAGRMITGLHGRGISSTLKIGNNVLE